MVTFSLVLLAILILGPWAPNIVLTPGVATQLTRTQVCAVHWGQDRRHVTAAMRRQVFAAYRVPYAKHALYKLDHLIPRELGGADVVANLWPQPWGGPLGAYAKDREEDRLHRAVCAGTVTLQDAQAQIRQWGTKRRP